MAARRIPAPAVLTIAGSDSCGGAGLEADLKTFSRCGVYGLCAVTAVTAQDGLRVYGVFPVRPAAVVAQAEAALRARRPEAVKTGMLWSAGIVEAVARFLNARRVRRFVLDPVLATHGGDPLALPGAGRTMVRRLFPLAALVTPNLREAEEISGVEIRGAVGLEEAARRILGKGPRAVLIKGGHGEGEATDWLFDREGKRPFSAARVRGARLHGSGCILSAAIAAGLARGLALDAAVREGKAYVGRQLKGAAGGAGGALLAAHI
jgi:hydroxymethylpyrimidine/phosphomethylpyrimidine kinase